MRKGPCKATCPKETTLAIITTATTAATLNGKIPPSDGSRQLGVHLPQPPSSTLVH